MIFDYLLAHNRFAHLIGISVILVIALILSKNRSHIKMRTIINGLLFQALLAFIMLKTSGGSYVIAKIAEGIAALYRFADEGTAFLFGSLSQAQDPWGFIFAIKILPIIIFFGAFMSVLFYYGIVQSAVGFVSKLIRPLLGTSGAESLCAVANCFLGQTEAPLLIRHYLARLTTSEIFVVMVSGMGTISGSILAAYVGMGIPAQYLLAASIMAIPAALVIAKIMVPEIASAEAIQEVEADVSSPARNVLDAIAQGTTDGLQLALNVGAMLISFIGLIALINGILAAACTGTNYLFEYIHVSMRIPCISLQMLFGIFFAPFGWFLGLSGEEIFKAGSLIGTKVAVNEMVAYRMLLKAQLSERAIFLLTVALCGFANFLSIGIQLGGIGALAPSKRVILSELGLRAMIGGTLVSLLSAMMVGLFL